MMSHSLRHHCADTQSRRDGVSCAESARQFMACEWSYSQNPLPQHFTKEMVDAIECMSDTGDVARCNHYMEVAYRKTHEESSKPGMLSKVSASVGLMGT